ncbi:unnamed protein product [Schistosoma curassoni]|uniref:Transposase n=1 Tax=Schistosoma curassoni TaxID=6186 RepID=A0A183K7N7_9TREM|nr:unnamed protein product [Schistosoma curassoni]
MLVVLSTNPIVSLVFINTVESCEGSLIFGIVDEEFIEKSSSKSVACSTLEPDTVISSLSVVK